MTRLREYRKLLLERAYQRGRLRSLCVRVLGKPHGLIFDLMA